MDDELDGDDRDRRGWDEIVEDWKYEVETSREKIAALQAALSEATRREEELRNIGGQLANVAFNLKQTDQPERTRQTLEKCQQAWDALIAKHNAARRAALPEETRHGE